jgi:hypothetical protein
VQYTATTEVMDEEVPFPHHDITLPSLLSAAYEVLFE